MLTLAHKGAWAPSSSTLLKGDTGRVLLAIESNPLNPHLLIMHVQAAWGQAHNAGGKVRMISDMNAEVTKAMDVGMDAMGCLRTRRFSMVIQDNVVKALNLQDSGEVGCGCN